MAERKEAEKDENNEFEKTTKIESKLDASVSILNIERTVAVARHSFCFDSIVRVARFACHIRSFRLECIRFALSVHLYAVTRNPVSVAYRFQEV